MNTEHDSNSPSSPGPDADDVTHWDSLLESLGARQPDDDWDTHSDEASELPVEGHSAAPASGPTPPAQREAAGTDWGAIAGQLGVQLPADFEETEVLVEETAALPAGAPAAGGEADRIAESVAESDEPPTSAESSDWQRSWPDESDESHASHESHESHESDESDESHESHESDESEHATASKTKQADLDRMFGADSTRPLDPAEDSRPRYFDLADEEEYYSNEVHFAQQEPAREERPTVAESRPDSGREERRRRGGRSRRSKPRRRERSNAARETHVAPDAESDDGDALEQRGFDAGEELFGPGILADAGELDELAVGTERADDEAPPASPARKPKQRKAASWKEAVGLIIANNLEQRDRDSSSNSSRRRGGGRRRR